MVDAHDRQYRPDYAIPPGETVRSTLEALDLSQADLARRSGLSTKHINQIIGGTASISPETALAFERVLGVPARFWNALEANYQARQARLRDQDLSNEDIAWLKGLPIAALTKQGYIEPTKDKLALRDQVLSFFGVATREAWQAVWQAPDVAYRRSAIFEADPFATAAWLRIGELQANGVEVEPFDRGRFETALGEIRAAMVDPPERFEPLMRRRCAESGVVLAIVPEIGKCRANGATRWLSPTKALIQLSLRGRWEDVFWFSFFHEAGHVLLHGKRDVFVDDDRPGGDAKEEEADRFASTFLIPSAHEGELLRIRTVVQARTFAQKLGIPPAIVIGRLHRERLLPYNQGNRDRRQFQMG